MRPTISTLLIFSNFVATFIILPCSFVDGKKLRLCVIEGVHTQKRIKKNCPTLDKPETEVQCVFGTDRFDCLWKVAQEESDLTVLEPEDLIAAAAWTEFQVLVTNELRFAREEKYQYQVAALMRNSAGIQGLSDVKEKRFCHPGYESTSDWTPALATYFENILIRKECDPNKTLIENRVHAASKYFGAACMAGPWTADTKLDSEMKARYRNLCAICNNPAGCYATDKHHGEEGVLLCLTDNYGDIAWVRVSMAQEHFKALGVSTEDYSYLCPDGSTRAMQTEEPCFWITKPWPVLVANRKKSEAVAVLMASLDPDHTPWHDALLNILENYNLVTMNPDNLGTPDDYLRRVPGFLSANSRASCKPFRTVQWCVSSNIEQRKCISLHLALFAYGVEPKVSCVTRRTRVECIDAVKEGQVDLFVVNPDEELIARQKGLKDIVHIFTNKKEDINKVAAVVRSNSNIKTLKELKGLKACFTGYRSIGWNAFVSIMRSIPGSDWDPSDAKAVSNFFSESCVQGLEKTNYTFPSNLRSLCKEDAGYGDEESAFKCLVNGGGDVAFISLDTVKQNTGSENQRVWAHGLKRDDFKSICHNESDTGNCFLTWTTLGSVMVRENISAVRHEEIYSMLLEMDQLFGQTYKGQTPAFLLYGSYEGNHSIIFPRQTQHLQADVSHVRFGRNYETIVDDLIKNPPHNGASKLQFNSSQLATICIAISIIISKTTIYA